MSGRTAIVTGAAAGIGAATVALLGEHGWTVVGIDRDWPGGDAPEGSIALDLADHGELREAIADFGDLGLLVNVAGVMSECPLEDLEAGEITRTLDVNLTAAIVATGAAVPGLAAGDDSTGAGGAVVNVASVHALASRWGLAAYAASKGGLLAFTRQAAVELGPRGIRVNAVVPGAVDTAMLGAGAASEAERKSGIDELAGKTPLGRVAEPREIAEAIAFLADPEHAGFITGQSLAADGGVLARLSSE